MLDGEAFGAEIVDLVRGYVEREIEPLKAENESLKERLAALEARPAPERGEKGEDGASPEPEAVAAALLPIAEELVAEAVSKAVAEFPSPEKGDKGAAGERGEPGEKGADGRDGADGLNGKDGAGIVDGFVSREGHLIATLSDGTTRDFGEIIGKDGEPGKDGRDGFGFDDMDACVLDDDRTIELSFRRGDEEKCFTFKWPAMIYRGVWRGGDELHTYAAGDSVTWGGSLWVAEKDTTAKPDTPDSGWKLAVKKGRDGKDSGAR